MDYFASVRIYLEFVPLLSLSREVDLPLVVALVDNGSSHEILANEDLSLDGFLLKGEVVIVELECQGTIVWASSFLWQVDRVELLQ